MYSQLRVCLQQVLAVQKLKKFVLNSTQLSEQFRFDLPQIKKIQSGNDCTIFKLQTNTLKQQKLYAAQSQNYV